MHAYEAVNRALFNYAFVISRAKTNIDLFVLSKEYLDVLLNNFPQVKRKVTTIAEEIKERFDEQNLPDKGVVGFDVQKFDSKIRKEVIYSLYQAVPCFV